ncbi:hypothetical protein COOONC_03855 [Cooperia oncophora]
MMEKRRDEESDTLKGRSWYENQRSNHDIISRREINSGEMISTLWKLDREHKAGSLLMKLKPSGKRLKSDGARQQ